MARHVFEASAYEEEDCEEESDRGAGLSWCDEVHAVVSQMRRPSMMSSAAFEARRIEPNLPVYRTGWCPADNPVPGSSEQPTKACSSEPWLRKVFRVGNLKLTEDHLTARLVTGEYPIAPL